MQGSTGHLTQMTNNAQAQIPFGGQMFDPSNPALFNFDLEGLNFGNHYGALEFGMLGHMSSGAVQTPSDNIGRSMSKSGSADMSFNSSLGYQPNTGNVGQYGQLYNQQDTMIPDFTGLEGHNNTNLYAPNNDIQRLHNLPHAYAIAAGPTSLASPSTTDNNASPQPSTLGFDSSPTTVSYQSNSQQPHHHHRPSKQQNTKPYPLHQNSRTVLGKRNRDPSSIYDTVVEPYPYTTGFHSLTAFLQKRFSANKTLRIAKSLASIRPSFISCTKTLNRQDLIFMEKCFQRTLFEYEEFMIHCCTPTLVLRRTGEVAAVNKEFTLLTGWRKDVLLGREPNLNTNTGNTASALGSSSNSGRAGQATPRSQAPPSRDGKPQAVFLAELLDDDSVVEFYDDFAKLAFGDSRGSVVTTCRVLKYRTKEPGMEDGEGESERGIKRSNTEDMLGNAAARVSSISGEHGIGRLERDGKMECSYCWMVKRDVFDIPMMIVMNVSRPLPVLNQSQCLYSILTYLSSYLASSSYCAAEISYGWVVGKTGRLDQNGKDTGGRG